MLHTASVNHSSKHCMYWYMDDTLGTAGGGYIGETKYWLQ